MTAYEEYQKKLDELRVSSCHEVIVQLKVILYEEIFLINHAFSM